MNDIQRRQKELLDDTVAHFNSANRAYDEDAETCTYSHYFNGGCAIGRKLSPDLAATLGATSVSRVFDRLPASLIELGVDFLQHLQNLHDMRDNWWPAGLSSDGKMQYHNLCGIYGLS